ncbi:MAG: hypothetical protein ACQEQD_11030 [Bacillota bacterium]
MSTADKLREEGKLDGIKEGRKEELIETIILFTTIKLEIDSLSPEIERKLNNTGLETLKIIRDNLLTIESIEDLEKYLN